MMRPTLRLKWSFVTLYMEGLHGAWWVLLLHIVKEHNIGKLLRIQYS